jgi:dienelactone hydrolase
MRATRRLIRIAGQATVALAAVALAGSAAPLRAQWASDEWLEKPVDQATFESWRPFFSYDAGVPFDLQTISVENVEGIRVERVAFTGTPGDTVFADYYAVRAAKRDRPHVVLVHGGSRSGKESVRPSATLLVRRGYGVIAIDMPYFGERDTGLLGSFSEADKHEGLYNRESTYLEWVLQVIKEVGRTIDLVVEHYGASPDRIAYVGFSRGAQVGFLVVGVEERLHAAALIYGGHFDRSETGHLAAACPANYIGRIAPRPLWLLNGAFDGDYDRERSVEPLQRHAGEPTEIHWVETGHQFPSAQDLGRMADWLDSVMD